MADVNAQIQSVLQKFQGHVFGKSDIDRDVLEELTQQFKELRALIREDRSDAKALQKLGDLFGQVEDFDGASEAYILAADTFARKGEFPRAAGVLKVALRHNENSHSLLEKLGDLYVSADRYNDALEQYNKLILLFEKEGAWGNSFSIFHKIERISEPSAALYTKKGEAFLASGRIEQAIQAFMDGLDVLSEEERWEDFVRVAERLLYIRPGNIEIIQHLAKVYLEHNKLKKALQLMQRAFKLDPENVETLELLYHSFEKLNNEAKVLTVLHKLANLHIKRNNFDHAWLVYEKILEKNPGDTLAQNILEEYSRQQRMKVDEKIRELQVYFKHHLFESAEKALEDLRQISSDPKVIKHFEIEFLLAQNQREEAAKELLELALSVENAENALYYLQTLLSIEGLVDYGLYEKASKLEQGIRAWLPQVQSNRLFHSTEEVALHTGNFPSFTSLTLLSASSIDESLRTNDFENIIQNISESGNVKVRPENKRMMVVDQTDNHRIISSTQPLEIVSRVDATEHLPVIPSKESKFGETELMPILSPNPSKIGKTELMPIIPSKESKIGKTELMPIIPSKPASIGATELMPVIPSPESEEAFEPRNAHPTSEEIEILFDDSDFELSDDELPKNNK